MNNLSISRKRKLTLLIGFLPLLVLCASIQFYQHIQLQHKQATNSIANVINNLEFELGEKQRLLDLFSENNRELLGKIVEDSNNIHTLSLLSVRAKQYFPDNFAVSIADNSGEIILDDFDGLIGDVCRLDLKHQLESKQYKARVHPNPNAYHYDISSTWYKDDQRYLLFASFNTERIADIIKTNEIIGQKLYLVIKKFDYLVEVTSSGDRSKLELSNNFKLTKSQINNILVEKKINNSYWTLIAIKDNRYHNSKILKDIIFYVIIYIVYILFIQFVTRTDD